jgi:hypothetical protein
MKIEHLTAYHLVFCEKFASAVTKVFLMNEGGDYVGSQ